MKQLSPIYLFLLMMLTVAGNQARSQQAGKETDQLAEKVVLATDREIYCVDDEIFLSAFNVSPGKIRNVGWSNVLYVELTDNKGTAIVQEKLPFQATGASGGIKIPNWLLTGNYYLRAYTRWMRNYPVESYAYKRLTILNPYRSELLEDYAEKSTAKNTSKFVPAASAAILVNPEKSLFVEREQVNVEISVAGNADLNGKYAVSVIPKGAEVRQIFHQQELSHNGFVPGLIPETRGVSVSGKIINETDSLPMAFTLVGLTILGEHPENLNIMTDEKGRFFFDLRDRKGEGEIFISARSGAKNRQPVILIDNDFSKRATELPFVPVDFSGEAKALYRTLMLNTQIAQKYASKEDSIVAKPKMTGSEKIFYGDPEFVVRLDDFIPLPTVQDYFLELIHNAKVRKEEGKHVLKVINKYGLIEPYEPLILLDMVTVFDLDKILELKPEKIERIEIITSEFIRGNITYGGIVSFISKKNDMAGIDLPASGRFVSYRMFDDSRPLLKPEIKSPQIPDMRNCLYWNPELQIKSGESQRITFSSGDNYGSYLVVVQGVDQSGILNVTTREITIK